jgi:hypothetical protein
MAETSIRREIQVCKEIHTKDKLWMSHSMENDFKKNNYSKDSMK